MSKLTLQIIDYFFILFHGILILFNVFGWIVPKWRFPNLITLHLPPFRGLGWAFSMALVIVLLRIGIGKCVNFWDIKTKAIPISIFWF